ncbi:MAG: hypothetical protein ABI720_05030 [Actinomycetes bacterium]
MTHTKSRATAAGVGAFLGLVTSLLYLRYQVASEESFMNCGTFSECTEPEGGFLFGVFLTALLIPGPVLWFSRVPGATLLALASPVLYTILAFALLTRYSYLPFGPVNAVLLMASFGAVLAVSEVVVGRGYQPLTRLLGAVAVVALMVTLCSTFSS